ncbi:MAG: F0F1 ATP synthase subunit A [Candidatus Pacebacteria bacterium]|nr:F0F1 ATP synthase subunit A [Candidatus Paceibacterota bacterium]
MSAGPHISISAETISYFAGIPISNSILTSLVASGLLIAFAIMAKRSLNNKDVYGRPSAFQNFSEMIVEGLYSFVDSVTHDKKKAKVFLPFIASFFLWILFNNWLGLLPGVGTIGITHEPEHASLPSIEVQASEVVAEDHGLEEVPETTDDHDEAVVADEHGEEKTFIPIFRAGTADLNTTIALAIVSVVVTQIIGVKYLSIGYFKKYFNFSSPIMFFVGILELVLEFAKIMSFAFRLFGNVFAGEVLLAVILFLVPVIAPMPFYGLEIFVGFIQALVFAMLSLVFFNMATISHDEH